MRAEYLFILLKHKVVTKYTKKKKIYKHNSHSIQTSKTLNHTIEYISLHNFIGVYSLSNDIKFAV